MRKDILYKIKLFCLTQLGIIPEGDYCHSKNRDKVCRYWSLRADLPYRENGYCAFLDKSDWEINEELGMLEGWDREGIFVSSMSAHDLQASLLWDQCKEC